MGTAMRRKKIFKFEMGDIVKIRPDAQLPDPQDDPYRNEIQTVIGCVERIGCCPLYDLSPYYALVSEDALERT